MAAVQSTFYRPNRARALRALLRHLCTTIVLLLAGCGGGTSGTDGGNSLRIGGAVRDTNGAPLSGVQIVVDESGDSSNTDADGAFLIQTTIPASTATLRISSGTAESTTTVSDIPADGSVVSVSVTIDPGSGTIAVTDITIAPFEEPTIAPTPGTTGTPQATPPAGARTPTATPTPTPRAESVLEGTITIKGLGPLQDAFVYLAETDTTIVTAESGFFRFRYPAGIRTLHLAVASEVGQGNLTLARLPAEPRRISIQIELGRAVEPGTEETPTTQEYQPSTTLTITAEQRKVREF